MLMTPVLTSTRAHGSCMRLPSHRVRQVRSRKFLVMSTADWEGCKTVIDPPVKIVGMGSCGMDYLAAVSIFPKPDEKLRTERLELKGGGNCANALTASARLGLSPCLVTKIGGDALGDEILKELQEDGVDTNYIMREAGQRSPFTYVIVDKTCGTRTCIHTPGAPTLPSEMTDEVVDSILEGAQLAFFDGRLAEAALVLARAARERGIPVIVEAERLRPNLETLLEEADFVVTSAGFPQDWTGEVELGDAIVTSLRRLPNAKWIITTLGKRGSVCVERVDSPAAAYVPLADVMDQLFIDLEVAHRGHGSTTPDCVSRNGVAISAGSVVTRPGIVQCGLRRGEGYSASVTERAMVAAARAAAVNADMGNTQGYLMAKPQQPVLDLQLTAVIGRVTAASAANIPQDAVVDTTGAGDSFIGSMLYGIATGMSVQKAMRLAALVAACNCTGLGPRSGLPTRENLALELMGPSC